MLAVCVFRQTCRFVQPRRTGCGSTVPFRQKLLKFAVELGEWSSQGYPSSLKRENCTNNRTTLQERDGATRQMVSVSAGTKGKRRRRRKKEEGKAVNRREMMRLEAGKAMGVERNDSLYRGTSVGPPRAIYFPRSLTAFALVGSRFVIRRHTSSPTFLLDDLLCRYLFTTSWEELISGSTGTRNALFSH